MKEKTTELINPIGNLSFIILWKWPFPFLEFETSLPLVIVFFLLTFFVFFPVGPFPG